jgi:hypothetical protein
LANQGKIDLDGDFISNVTNRNQMSIEGIIRREIIKDFQIRFREAQKKVKKS